MGKVTFTVLIALVIAAVVFFIKKDDTSLYSPVPKVFGTSQNKPVNTWFPKKSPGQQDSQNRPLNNAKSAIVVDYGTGQIIYEKNVDQRLPTASTVKIMTALIALQNAKLDDLFTVSVKAVKVGENSMGLAEGEKLTLEELLYGLMLVSGNDAALTIAEGIAGAEEKFVELMNQKAQNLGLKDTKFVNASGLDEDEKVQYSTAYDMVVIARYTWENYPRFRQITSTYHHYIEINANHKAFELYNDTNLLTTYPGVKGIKPGFTWEAGLCLVSYSENEDKKLLAVILGSDNRRAEMKELLDYGFSYYGIKVNHPALD